MYRDFDSFAAQGKNEKMSKLLYTYYIGNVNGIWIFWAKILKNYVDTITKVLKERERIRKKGKKMSMIYLEASAASEYYSPKQTAMTEKAKKMVPYGMLSFDRKLDRLEEKQQTKIQAIEVV